VSVSFRRARWEADERRSEDKKETKTKRSVNKKEKTNNAKRHTHIFRLFAPSRRHCFSAFSLFSFVLSLPPSFLPLCSSFPPFSLPPPPTYSMLNDTYIVNTRLHRITHPSFSLLFFRYRRMCALSLLFFFSLSLSLYNNDKN
jgi:hypothetical protein